MIEHKIKIKAEEMHKEEDGKSMIGYGVGIRYEGPNKDGITPEMAICAIGGLLTAIDLDKDEVEKITDGLTKLIIKDEGRFTTMGDSFEEAEERADTKKTKRVQKAVSTFLDLITDSKWRKLIRHEVDFCEDDNAKTRFLAWSAVMLRELSGLDKECAKVMEKMFFEEVVGFKNNGKDKDEE